MDRTATAELVSSQIDAITKKGPPMTQSKLGITEEWRPVRGFEGIYEVSNRGRVRGVDRIIKVSGQPDRRIRGVEVKSHKGSHGYAIIRLRGPNGRKTEQVHVLVLEAFVGPRPSGRVAAHYDNDRWNNDLSNLRWATVIENENDKARHGTKPIGEMHYCAKISDSDVKRIRIEYAVGRASRREIASRYGVSPSHISDIIHKRKRKHA